MNNKKGSQQKKAKPLASDAPDLKSLRRRAERIYKILHKAHNDATCELNFKDPLQLLVATILSAQCTDKRVNMVTPALFQRCPTAQAYAEIEIEELEELIRSTGFFRSKAKNIKTAASFLVSRHGGQVPATLEELVKLPGVGRKTANVVLGNWFDIPGITVDTHVGRVSRRLGFTKAESPEAVELDLMKLLDRKEWTMFSHVMIFHGRRICDSRKPKCAICPVNKFCPSSLVN